MRLADVQALRAEESSAHLEKHLMLVTTGVGSAGHREDGSACGYQRTRTRCVDWGSRRSQ